MAEVIQLADHRPHTTGPAICLQCRYECIAVIPTGLVCTECPECGLSKLVRKGLVELQDDGPLRVWVCSCGNQLFEFYEGRGLLCVTCGSWQKAGA